MTWYIRALWACLFLLPVLAHAEPQLSVLPDSSVVEVSAEVTVEVQIADLNGSRVGAYDFNFSWDPAILGLNNVTPGNELDGPALSFYATNETAAGTLNLAEFSFDTLNGQVEPVVLATLTFTALAAGEGALGVSGNIAPGAGFLGDASGAPLPVSVAVTSVVVNGAPVAEAQSVTTDEDVATTIILTGSDVNGDALDFTLESQPSIGALSGTPPNLTYTPNANLNGSDSFTFSVDDGLLTSSPATVDITINSVNDPPIAGDDVATTLEDTPIAIAVLANDSDVEGDALSVVGVTNGAFGVASTDGNIVTYFPGPDANGTDVLNYTLSDGSGTVTGTVSVTIIPVNDPPNAVNDEFSVGEDGVLTVAAPGVLNNDVDVDGDALMVSIATAPAYGALLLDADGSFSYTPNANYFGSDSFTYTLDDGQGGVATGSAAITVDAVNDAPAISVDLSSQAVQYSDAIAAVTVTATDIDSTLTPGSLTSSMVPAGLSVTAGSCNPAELGPVGVIGVGSTCAWTISGNVDVGAGTYTPEFSVSDDQLSASTASTVTVGVEDAEARISEDNIHSVTVDNPGSDSSLAFTLSATVRELTPDEAVNAPAPGDINRADVTIRLVPVGPGGTVSALSCAPILSGTGYDAELVVECAFDNAPVNTYTVELIVDGAFYTGADEDVFTVFDPSLGFTTGGGWFYWPGTATGSYSGDRTNFGYTMKYNKKATKVRGSLLLIRRTESGGKYRVKSNALEGLALGEDKTVPVGWATFSGKNTYLEPGWDEAVGNHGFTAYVEDRDAPGNGIDRIWIEVRDRQGIQIPQNSMNEPAAGHAAEIQGGNIFVPHRSRP